MTDHKKNSDVDNKADEGAGNRGRPAAQSGSGEVTGSGAGAGGGGNAEDFDSDVQSGNGALSEAKPNAPTTGGGAAWRGSQ